MMDNDGCWADVSTAYSGLVVACNRPAVNSLGLCHVHTLEKKDNLITR